RPRRPRAPAEGVAPRGARGGGALRRGDALRRGFPRRSAAARRGAPGAGPRAPAQRRRRRDAVLRRARARRGGRGRPDVSADRQARLGARPRLASPPAARVTEDPGLIRRVFHEALDRSPEERTEYLAAACGGNASLRREVEELLRALSRADADGFIAGSAEPLSATDPLLG